MANIGKKLKPVVYGIIIILVLVGITMLFSPKEKSKSRLFYEENITKEIAPDAVHLKEMVSINYVLLVPSENNKVIDTNDGVLAKEYGLKTFVEGPFRFIAGKSGKVKGFDDAVIGMKVGETKEVLIFPSEPVTKYVINKTREFLRNQQVAKKQGLSAKSFEKLFGKKARINDVVVNPKFPWKYKVISISNDGIIIDAVVKEGEEVQLLGLDWTSRILVVSENDFMVRHDPKEGQFMKTQLGPAQISVGGTIKATYQVSVGQLVNYSREAGGISMPHLFKVTSVTDRNIVLERDDNPAEKKLLLKVTLLDRSTVNRPE